MIQDLFEYVENRCDLDICPDKSMTAIVLNFKDRISDNIIFKIYYCKYLGQQLNVVEFHFFEYMNYNNNIIPIDNIYIEFKNNFIVRKEAFDVNYKLKTISKGVLNAKASRTMDYKAIKDKKFIWRSLGNIWVYTL
jgi:hypothetical protein